MLCYTAPAQVRLRDLGFASRASRLLCTPLLYLYIYIIIFIYILCYAAPPQVRLRDLGFASRASRLDDSALRRARARGAASPGPCRTGDLSYIYIERE